MNNPKNSHVAPLANLKRFGMINELGIVSEGSLVMVRVRCSAFSFLEDAVLPVKEERALLHTGSPTGSPIFSSLWTFLKIGWT